MKLPTDITENEMKEILIDMWKEYVPDQSYEFISKLSWKYLKQLFDLIGTKDPSEQAKKWKIMEEKLHFAREAIKMILQKTKLVKIQIDEIKDQKNDWESLVDLEKYF